MKRRHVVLLLIILVIAAILLAILASIALWIALQRWWQAWSKAPPPPQLQALINSVAAGYGLHLYIRN